MFTGFAGASSQTQMQLPGVGRQAGTLDLLSSCDVGKGVLHHEAAGLRFVTWKTELRLQSS